MDEYKTFAVTLAHQAGKIMLEHFQVGVPTEIKPEAGNTPVTVADKLINDMVIDAVRTRFPEHAVLGEEQSLVKTAAPYTWVCDPIDGTMPYSAGVPTNVFSIALVDGKDGQPVLAIVFDPYMKRLYCAAKGKGATLNNTPIHVNEVKSLSDATIGTSSNAQLVSTPLP
jgi:myo-inositol-1(or 4)-monophosphatase